MPVRCSAELLEAIVDRTADRLEELSNALERIEAAGVPTRGRSTPRSAAG